MADEMMDNALGFLRHEKVVNAPLDNKVNFLRKKGLSDEQIATALDKVHPDKDFGEQVRSNRISKQVDLPSVPQIHQAVALPPPPISVWAKLIIAITGALSLGAAGAAGFFLRKWFDEQEESVNSLESEKQDRLLEIDSLKKHFGEVTSVLKQQTDAQKALNAAIQSLVKSQEKINAQAKEKKETVTEEKFEA